MVSAGKRRRRSVGWLDFLWFLALFAGGPPAPASAQVASVFTIRNVEVDQTSATAAQAREAALAEGQKKATQRLFERLVPPEQRDRLLALSPAQTADLVESYEVQNERSSSVRYIGTLSFRFRPGDVRGILRGAGISFSETAARPMLVLPVLRRDDTPMLWEDSNAWRMAWGQIASSEGLVPLVVPLGDLDDIGDITASQALDGDAARLSAIAERYGAGGALIPYAVFEPAAAELAVQVTVTRLLDNAAEPLFSETFQAQSGEDQDALTTRAARETARLIEERWKSATIVRGDRESTLKATVPLRSQDEWIAIRRGLSETSALRRTNVLTVNRSEAVVELRFVGEIDQLRLTLLQHGLSLAPVGAGDAGWELRQSRGLGPAVGASPAAQPGSRLEPTVPQPPPVPTGKP